MKFKIITLLLLLLISNNVLSKTIATIAIVNGEIITSYDVKQRSLLITEMLQSNKIQPTPSQITERALDELIEDKLKIMEASKYNIQISAEDVNNTISRMAKSQNKTNEELIKYFEAKGIKEQTLKSQIQTNLIWVRFVLQVLRSYVRVQDAEIQNFLDTISKQSYTYEIIPLVTEAEKLKTITSKIKNITNCDDFAKIATTLGNQSSGYKMTLNDNQMQLPLYDHLKNAELNKTLEPIEINNQPTIFFICNKKNYVPTLNDTETEQLRSQIIQDKIEALANKHLTKLKSNAIIDIKTN